MFQFRASLRHILNLSTGRQRKHVLKWLASQQQYYLIKHQLPWLSFDAIDFLDKHLPMRATVFEYGSGGSTLYWLSRGYHCTSVEHDVSWHELMSTHLVQYSNVDYRLVPPEPATAAVAQDFSNPEAYRSADVDMSRFTFRQYAAQIDSFADGYFSVVLVDGRARPACLMHSATKVTRGGLLILDNADRAYYLEHSRDYLRGFDEYVFRGAGPVDPHMFQTNIYVRTV